MQPMASQQPTSVPTTATPYDISPQYLQQLQQYMINPMMLNPTAYTGAVESAMQPQFKQQDRAAQAGLADAGIVGGPTSGVLGALGNQQQTQLAGQISPMIQSIMQGNQNAANNMGQFDVSTLLNANQFNANATNQFLSQGMGMQNQDWLAQLQAMEGMYQGYGNAFQPIYQQPGDMGSMGFGLGSMFPGASSSSLPPGGTGYMPPGVIP